MVIFLQIDCVKKQVGSSLILEITGLVKSQSSSEPPTQQTLKAIDQPYNVHWIHPTFGNVLIAHYTMNNTKCFVASPLNDARRNLLAELPNCE